MTSFGYTLMTYVTCPTIRYHPSVVARLAPLADHLTATEPGADLVKDWNEVRGAPTIGKEARRRPDPGPLGPGRGHGRRAGP